MEEILAYEYFGNTVLDYLIALGIILTGLILAWALRTSLIVKLRNLAARSETKADDFIISNFERFGIPAIYYFIIYAGIHYLDLSLKVTKVAGIVTTVVVTFLILRLLSSTILVLLHSHIRKQERGEEKINQLGGLMIVINIVIWFIGMVFLIDNLGGNVTAIIAGLGIGGIAVALAAQNILGDLFNYFVIIFDRPFEVGDFITVDDKAGTIEYIGIKTTRVRSLTGDQLIVGNSNLTGSRIHNFKRLVRRRVVFSIDVEYGTPIEKLRELPELFKTIVLQQEEVAFDRAHFAKYSDWSLRFEVVYFVLSGEYNTYMDVHQNINMQIYEAFSQRGISFAFPSQTIFFAPRDSSSNGIVELPEPDGTRELK